MQQKNYGRKIVVEKVRQKTQDKKMLEKQDRGAIK
jgi:hypothetical protein